MVFDKESLSEIPERIKILAPWLNEDYIKNHGWVPEKKGDLDILSSELYRIEGYQNTVYGELPIRDIRLIEPGDVIIYYEYDKWIEEGKEDSDRFEVIDEDFYKQIMEDEWGVPSGIVVPSPESYGKLSEIENFLYAA